MNDARETVKQARNTNYINNRAGIADWFAFRSFVMVPNLDAVSCEAKATEDDQETPSQVA
jgi:hypothetical protein